MGPMIMNSKNALARVVKSGETSSLITSGTFFSKKISYFAVTIPISKATIMPP